MTTICIRQPGYLPNIGFFKKIQSSDVFVYLDDAQYAIRSWDNRNKIRNANKISWLTVPVIHPYHKKLDDIEIALNEMGNIIDTTPNDKELGKKIRDFYYNWVEFNKENSDNTNNIDI